MKQIKIFSDNNPNALENKVNNFLKECEEEDLIIHSIQYQDQSYAASVMIEYSDEFKAVFEVLGNE